MIDTRYYDKPEPDEIHLQGPHPGPYAGDIIRHIKIEQRRKGRTFAYQSRSRIDPRAPIKLVFRQTSRPVVLKGDRYKD